MSAKATIQKSIDTARTSFIAWCILSKNSTSEKKELDTQALNALMDISDVISRGSLEDMCDLLSVMEVQAMIGAVDVINKDNPKVMLGMNHVIQRFMHEFAKSIGRKGEMPQ